MRRGEQCFQCISRVRRMRLVNDLSALILWATGLILAGLTVVAALFWSGWALLALVLPVGFLASVWLTGLSTMRLARRMEECFPETERKLVPALELAESSPGREGYSEELTEAAIADAEERIKGLALGRMVDRRRIVWGAVVLVAGLAMFLGYLGLSPTRSRLGLLNALAPEFVPVKFVVEPGDTALLPGAEAVLRCRVEPSGVFKRLVLERVGVGLADRRTLVLSGDVGQSVIRARCDFAYRFRILSRKSKKYQVQVIEPVSVERISFRYHYPAYSKLPEYRSSSTDITALKGTRIEVEGQANRALAGARVVLEVDTVALVVGQEATQTRGAKEAGFRGSFVITGDREGRLELADQRGTGYQTAGSLRVRQMPDEPPLVKLLLPGRDVDLPMSMQLVLGVNSLDDFGLEGLYLYYSKEEFGRWDTLQRTGFERKRLKFLAGKREDTTLYTWDLSNLGLLPGEAMSYYLAVSDNDAVSGPKFSRTDVFRVRFPTMTEIYNASVRQTERTTEELAPMRETQEKLGEQLERISQQLMKEGNLSWDERQVLSQVLADQGQLAQQIEDLKKDVAGLLDELSSGMQLDQETMERMGQLQELLSRLLPQELQQSLAKLSEELNRKSPDLRRALSEFKLNQEQLQQSIDQALEFLKRVLEEQKLEALARKADDLAKTQGELLGRLGAENPESLSRLESELGKGIDSLRKEMEELARTMSDSATADSLAVLAEGMKQDGLSEMANRTAQAMKQNANRQAKASGQKLEQELKSLSQSLNAISQGLKSRRSNEVARQLLAAAEELLAISQRQEQLADEVSKGQEVNLRAGLQMGLRDGTRVVAESLAALGARTMALSGRMVQELSRVTGSMEAAAQSLADARAGPARQQMLTAQAGLNQVVSMLLSVMQEQAQGGGMSGGMEGLLSQLSQLTADQMSINAGMGGIPIPIPGGLTPAQMAALDRIMSRQAALRERLQQLLEQMGGQQPGLTSSLEGVLEEMKRTERDLAELNISRELLERQESILSHLLDAQRSIRQRGFKEERESEAARPFMVGPAPKLPEDAGERNRFLREELMRSLKEARFGEYERMIRAYFEELLNQP